MKKNTKIILFTTLIIAVLAVTLTVALLAGNRNSAESISLSDSSKIQSVYVRGRELNLSGGTLTVDTGKKTTEIPLDAKGVTVSGYDKDVLGKQTVKIEYGGAATEITVTVVERVTVNGALTEYLVGDTFDQSKGVVKITDYDGTSRTVQFSSDSISVSGFDSSVAGEGKELRVVYTKNGESCEGTLKVNIYPIETVDFHSPNKVTYDSHYEGGPDASGGRFVLKGNGGAVKREVAITADMISGFDISEVTAENPSVTQRLTVTYNGVAYPYDVVLTYTDVSLFLDNAAAFLSVDWDGESEPEIEESLGKLAMDLMATYVDMPPSERALLDEETVFNVARAAMVYGFDIWADNIRLFKGVFAIEYGERVLYLESYDKVKASIALFDDKNSAIYTVSPLLLELIEMYGDRIVYENETTRIYFNSYPVMDSYELTLMRATLEHALGVYDLIKDIPDNWRTVGLTAYYDSLMQATVNILNETYVFDYPDLYYLISDWRTNSDLFDILYSYLYETDKTSMMETLTVYGLPTNICEFYVHTLTAVMTIEDLQEYEYLDTTKLLYHYYAASDIAKLLKAETETAENYLYLNVPVNLLFGLDLPYDVSFDTMFEYVRATVLDLTEGLTEVETYDAVIREYVALIKNIVETSGYENTAAYGESVKHLFDQFVALSPVQQYNLIAIFNMLYRYGIPSLAFDDADEYADYTSLFTLIINGFMRSRFSDEYVDTYNNLILAIEVFANRFDYPEWESDFTARMDKVDAAVKQMTGDDKTNFDVYLSAAYEKYKAIREDLEKTAELGEWADEFADLYKALKDMQTASYLMSTGSSYNYNYFLASFERASSIGENILKNAPDSVVYAYYYEPLFEAYFDASNKAVFWSCDYALNAYRDVYMKTLLHFGSSEVNLYDTYFERELDEFLSLYYGMVSAFVNRTEGQTPVFDRAETFAVLDAFRALDSETKALFIMLEGGVNMYDEALNLFVSEAFSQNAAEVARKLFALENGFYNYEVSESNVTLNSIQALLTELNTLYEALDGEDKTSFVPLEESYSYYVEKCEQLFV